MKKARQLRAGAVEDKAAGTMTYHWLQDRPHPIYNIMLAAGPFEVVRDRLGNLPVDYWVYPRDVADAPRSFRKTPAMIDFYGRTFDYPYPWAKYDQVCYAGYGGGASSERLAVVAGVCEAGCRELLQAFFRTRRAASTTDGWA